MRPHVLLDLETRLARGLRQDAAAAGYREATARLLLAIEPGEQVRMTELAHRVGRDPSTATRFVDRATADGLIARRPGVRDRRRRVVVLTPEGEAARAALVEARARRAGELGAAILDETGLGEDQVDWFLDAFVQALLRPTAS